MARAIPRRPHKKSRGVKFHLRWTAHRNHGRTREKGPKTERSRRCVTLCSRFLDSRELGNGTCESAEQRSHRVGNPRVRLHRAKTHPVSRPIARSSRPSRWMVDLRPRASLQRPDRYGAPEGDGDDSQLVGGAPAAEREASEVAGGDLEIDEGLEQGGAARGARARETPRVAGDAGTDAVTAIAAGFARLGELLAAQTAVPTQAAQPEVKGDAGILPLVDDEGRLVLPTGSRVRGTVGIVRDRTKVSNLSLEARSDIKAIREKFRKTRPGKPAECEYELSQLASADAFFASFLHVFDKQLSEIRVLNQELVDSSVDVPILEAPGGAPGGLSIIGWLERVRATIASFERFNYGRLADVSLRICALNPDDEIACGLWADRKRELELEWELASGVFSHLEPEAAEAARQRAKARVKAELLAKTKADATAAVAARKLATQSGSIGGTRPAPVQIPAPRPSK